MCPIHIEPTSARRQRQYASMHNLAIMALLLDEEENSDRVASKKRSIWVHDILKKRKIDGEYVTLCKMLEDPEEKFFKYFRMTRFQFNVLFLKIGKKEKLAVCLRFLGTGDSYQTIAFSFRLGHSTVQSIVLEVCSAIIFMLKDEYIPIPGEEDWKRIAEEFWEIWNFPNCIGALDGKHIVIEAPPNSGSLYFNYKKTFSIVLLALVDAQYKFVAVDIGAYCKNSDGGIFSNSNLGKALEKNKLNIPNEQYLPRPQVREDQNKRKFNDRLSRARKVVEDAFGQQAAKFRIYCRRLNALLKNADTIVMTTCILHIYIKEDATDVHSREVSSSSSLPAGLITSLNGQGGSAQPEAFENRVKFKKNFCSPAGKLPWE
ncbi:hypothetical protein QTP88_009138 [Uroleucon formosanum]